MTDKNSKTQPRMAAKGLRVKEHVPEAELAELWQQSLQGDSQALSALCAFAKEQEVCRRLNSRTDRAKLRALLSHESPKVRKNTARLLGALGQKNDLPALKQAAEEEQTLFVLPSLLLAVGGCAGEEDAPWLRQLIEKVSAQPMEEKHLQEISQAGRLALAKLEKNKGNAFRGFAQPHRVLLRSPGCLDLLGKELNGHLEVLEEPEEGLIVKTADYSELFNLRCFEEALLLLPDSPLPEEGERPQSWARRCMPLLAAFEELMGELFEQKPLRYRLELRNLPHQQRGELAKALAALERPGLLNAPGDYDAELRLVFASEQRKCRAYAKICRPADERFSYRKKTLSASINPFTAAAMMEFARPYMKANSRVIDPCCGSGTLLIERRKAGPAELLLGVDKSAQAIDAARENFRAGQMEGKVIMGDLRRFKTKEPFDELYANLPFGTRVETAQGAQDLYKALLGRLDELLCPEGFALLYTTQRAPLLRLMKKSSWKVVQERRFAAGGLAPWGMILKRK
jgi:16S rRNA G966 N2-methylase RsmD